MELNKIKEQISEFIDKTTFKTEDISVFCNETDGNIWCSIKTNEPQLLIGKNGEVLEAINHIARRFMEKGQNIEENSPILIIDINDYRKKRIENLKNLAHMLSERALFFKSSIEADPMSSFERRIIHEHLSNKANIKTESVGFGRDRRVVIKFTPTEQI